MLVAVAAAWLDTMPLSQRQAADAPATTGPALLDDRSGHVLNLSGPATMGRYVDVVEGSMAVELAEMIGQLRAELSRAMVEGEGADLRFELGAVDLELTVVVAKEASAGAKVRFWVVDASGDAKGSATTTQKIKLQLDPRRAGEPGKPLISGATESGER